MSNSVDKEQHWDSVISPKSNLVSFNFGEIWRYRDLMVLFVKRDIVTVYKQTILGPIWFLLQPVLTTLTLWFIFGRVAKISTESLPPILFYMGSLTLWQYFSDTLNTTSKTFTENASVFGKVYFPRLVLPLAKVISGLIKLGIQLVLFIIFWLYFVAVKGTVVPNWSAILLIPFVIALVALLSLGIGIIITSMTTKYRDLNFVISFGVQLLMYATPIIYPISVVPEGRRFWLWLNPLTSAFEAFKYAFLGKGVLDFKWLGYSVLVTVCSLLYGIIIFNKVEKRFVDTV